MRSIGKNIGIDSYAFVDGGSLGYVMSDIGRRYFGGNKPIIDWTAIRGAHRKVFYYDAIPVQQVGEDENTYSVRISPKLTELSNIERQNSFHVRTGDVRHRRRRGNEQKMVDVQLAVDALSMASRDLFSSVTIITGDLDFRPLIVALVEMGIEVNVMYPVGETNEALLTAADIAIPLDIHLVQTWLDSRYKDIADFPRVTYSTGLPHNSEPNRITTWKNENNHDECCLYLIDGLYKIYTNVRALFLSANHMVISSKNIESLRLYAREAHGIDVPDVSY